MTISTNHLVIIKLRDKLEAFHDALRYLVSLVEVKSTSHLRLHVFFVVVASEGWQVFISSSLYNNGL